MGYNERPLDNPINWSFRVGRLFDIDIRVHIAFVICAVVLIAMEMSASDSEASAPLGGVLVRALGTYAILFAVVLLHELGHCFGARYCGGEADEVLLWPLGGLAYTNPPHNPSAHMITTVAGPLVNVILCAVCSVVLVVWVGQLGAIPWNPLHPMWPVDRSILPTPAQLWVMRVFGISYILLLFNLLPIFPFDGGRMVQAWLWPKKGYRASMQIATATGMVGAIVVGLFSLFTEQTWLLLMIAVFGYMTCWRQRQQLRMQSEFDTDEFGYDFSRGYTSLEATEPRSRKPGLLAQWRARRATIKALEERKQQEQHQQAVEDILRKVAQSGLASLTPRQRRILEEETKRQQSLK
ncbi:MAG: hypothetical protein IID38_02430 [Planctomycetes bacterium]|nr:hypothetical protein [Planctomycetota bacterium]